jgi:hypothetical protein
MSPMEPEGDPHPVFEALCDFRNRMNSEIEGDDSEFNERVSRASQFFNAVIHLADKGWVAGFRETDRSILQALSYLAELDVDNDLSEGLLLKMLGFGLTDTKELFLNLEHL